MLTDELYRPWAVDLGTNWQLKIENALRVSEENKKSLFGNFRKRPSKAALQVCLWLITLSSLQLQSEYYFRLDYYFTMYMVKKRYINFKKLNKL